MVPPASPKLRARDLGIPFDGVPGPLNAITDVAGVEVGHTTLIAGEGELRVGSGPVRTGVTAVHPRGKDSADPAMAGWFPLNGNGELTGAAWIEESGWLEGPVLLTNTHSLGTVRDAVIAWHVSRGRLGDRWSLPVVAETYDGYLNDINGFHVRSEHVFAALDSAAGGPVAEGSVGGGTGMICHGFKGGIGTSSRRVTIGEDAWVLGVLAQCNYGSRQELLVAGVPVGREIPADVPLAAPPGSVVALVGTDAPLLPHQLRRVARRVSLGIARTGSVSANGSGDLFLAFSTANPGTAAARARATVAMLPDGDLTPLFAATVQATEEAVVNALVAAETMTGASGRRAVALPHRELRDVLRRHSRLVEREDGGERDEGGRKKAETSGR